MGDQVHFVYDGSACGDESIDYVIDVSSTEVRNGLLRVEEISNGTSPATLPLIEGGLAFRTDFDVSRLGFGPYKEDFETPAEFAGNSGTETMLLIEHFDADAGLLRLQYMERRDLASYSFEGVKTYEFRIVGKVLRVRAYGDPSVEQFIANYTMFLPGPSQVPPNTSNPGPLHSQHIPYMDNVNVVRFANDRFYSVYLDPYQSNGGYTTMVHGDPNLSTTTSFEEIYTFPSTLRREDPDPHVDVQPPYKILANVDDTLNVIVTGRIEDAFPVPPHYRSPYHALTRGRMSFFCPQAKPRSWTAYRLQYEELASFGLSNLLVLQYGGRMWQPTPILTPEDGFAAITGCEPSSLVTVPGSTTYSHPINGDIKWYRPSDNQAVADAEFSALSAAATNAGALFVSQVAHTSSDPWGHPQPAPLEPYIISPGSSGPYPTDGTTTGSIPLSFENTWTISDPLQPDVDLGLLIPSSNGAYDRDKVTIGVDGNYKAAWDIKANFSKPSDACTWLDYGFRLSEIDSAFTYDHLIAQVAYGVANYDANAALWDASDHLPTYFEIDETVYPSDQRTHTYREVLRRRIRTARDLRDYVGGPIYGEGPYWRLAQAYEHGARDGSRWKWPESNEFPLPQISNDRSWVIPDFNLRRVLPQCSGVMGNGTESEHHFPVPPTGMDGTDGDSKEIVDSWITTIATYGNNPFAFSPGHQPSQTWTYQGIIDQYAVLQPLAEEIMGRDVVSVEYFDPSVGGGTYFELGEAIERGMDFINPLVRVTYTGGLEVFANHQVPQSDPTAHPTAYFVGNPLWTVDVKKVGGGTEQVELSHNGFAAGDGSSLMIIYNGRPTAGPSPVPFNYARHEGRLVMLTNRGPNVSGNGTYDGATYDGFPGDPEFMHFGSDELDVLSEGSILRNESANVIVGAVGGKGKFALMGYSTGKTKVETLSSPTDPIPAYDTVEITAETTTLALGKREGVTATAKVSGGSRKRRLTSAPHDPNGGLAWQVFSGPASINQNGVVVTSPTAAAPAQVRIQATWHGMVSNTLVFDVVELIGPDAGDDQVTATGTDVRTGEAVRFDATGTSYAFNRNLDYRWDFGDGSPPAHGAVTSHSYVTPPTGGSTYTATLNVRDVEDNVATDSVVVEVGAMDSYDWADSFDDGDTFGWLPKTGLFGIWRGSACMFDDGVSFQWAQADASFEHASVATELTLPDVQTAEAGVFARLTSTSFTPETKGYRATLNEVGSAQLYRAGALVGSGFIAGFDPSRRHDLRLVTEPFSSQAHAVKRAKVYVDGRLAVVYTNGVLPDPGPPALAVLGLCSEFQSSDDSPATFDEFRVAPASAPFVTVSPLELNRSLPTFLTFTIDDQNLVPDLDLASFTLTVEIEGGCAIPGFEGTYTLDQLFASGLATNFTYETGMAATSTWVSFDLAFDLESTFAACTDAAHPAERMTMTLAGQDVGGNRETRTFRFER